MHDMMNWFIVHPFYMMIGMGIYFIVSFTLAYVVYRDILRKGLSDAVFWFIIILFFNIIGFLFYLILGESSLSQQKQVGISTQSLSQNSVSDMKVFCPHCGTRIQGYAQFCPQCGASLE